MQLTTPADTAGRVTDALKSAAQATGAGFDYLVRTAKRESSLNPAAQNPGSSARGLFQFIDSTWLQVLKEEGGKLGMADAAASVQKSDSGRYTVQDPARRAELLAMRNDPQASALLAGAFTRRNAESLSNSLGRAPSEGELYAAHFLGAQGAAQLVTLASSRPGADAASAFPAQAAANRAIFFDKGRARSASEVYDRLTATAGAVASVPSIASAAPIATAAQIRVVQKTDDVEPVYNNGVENDQAAFHSLFKTGRRSPVATYVAQAWSAFGEAGLAADMSGNPSRQASETIAPAYAPQASAAKLRPATSAAAVDAVNRAAVLKPRRAVVATVPTATSAPIPVDLTHSVETARAATPAITSADGRPGGFIAFLKTVFSPPAASQAAPASAKIGPRP